MDEAQLQHRKEAAEQDRAQARFRVQQHREQQRGVIQYAEANASAWAKAHPTVVAEAKQHFNAGNVDKARQALSEHLRDSAAVETVISFF